MELSRKKISKLLKGKNQSNKKLYKRNKRKKHGNSFRKNDRIFRVIAYYAEAGGIELLHNGLLLDAEIEIVNIDRSVATINLEIS